MLDVPRKEVIEERLDACKAKFFDIDAAPGVVEELASCHLVYGSSCNFF